MTTKKNDSVSEKKGRVKVSKLQVNKETIKDLTHKEAEQIKGGGIAQPSAQACTSYLYPNCYNQRQ
jgi:hypothetical protein